MNEITRNAILTFLILALFSVSASAEPFTAANPMLSARYAHTATLLTNGKVLIVGGYNINLHNVLNSAELYDPNTGTFSATGNMATARNGHIATLLPNGKVLITGGDNTSTVLNSPELYDPTTGTFSLTGNMATARIYHSATLLANGKVPGVS